MSKRLQAWFKEKLLPSQPDPTRLKLTRRRIYILPTPQGIAFVFVLFLMLLGDINYGLSMGYMLTFLLAVIAIISILYTFRNLSNLEIQLTQNEAVFCGDTAWFKLKFHSEFERYRLCLSDIRHHAIYIDVKPDNPAASTIHQDILFAVPTQQRGWLALGPLTLHTEFPLGLCRAWCYLHFDHSCLVYPRPAPSSPLPLANNLQPNGQVNLAGDEDFAGLRKFIHGDVLSHVDWKAFARERGLLVKQFVTPTGNAIWLELSQVNSSDLEQKLSCLTRWVLDAEHQGLEYGLRLPGLTLNISRGDHHRNECLKQLALFQPERGATQ